MNAIKKFFLHIRGKFFGSSGEDVPDTGDFNETEDGKSGKTSRKHTRFPGVDYSKFMRETGEPYVPSAAVWTAIFEDMEASREFFPAEFGEFVNFARVADCSKAATWEVWAFRQSGIYMRRALPPDHYENYRRFIIALELASQHELSASEVSLIESLLLGFRDYYEREMYRYVIYKCKLL